MEPGWHAWMSYQLEKPPTEDAVLRPGQRSWELPEHRENLTASRAAFKTYSTLVAIPFLPLLLRCFFIPCKSWGGGGMREVAGVG